MIPYRQQCHQQRRETNWQVGGDQSCRATWRSCQGRLFVASCLPKSYLIKFVVIKIRNVKFVLLPSPFDKTKMQKEKDKVSGEFILGKLVNKWRWKPMSGNESATALYTDVL